MLTIAGLIANRSSGLLLACLDKVVVKRRQHHDDAEEKNVLSRRCDVD